MSIVSFEEFGLAPALVQTVTEMGYEQPTPIQQEAIPFLLQGRDLLGQAQTGTGKTAAFILPLLHTIPLGSGSVRALVMTPTRELALQVADAANTMGKGLSARVLAVYGGQPYATQTRQLKRGVDLVIGTPGRLLDLIRQGALDLSEVRFLVLDEADEMLEMGFIEDVETILAYTAHDRQMALFSATMPDAVRKLADRYLNKAEEIIVSPSQVTVEGIDQRFCRVRDENKAEALIRFIEAEAVKSALIFARTRVRAQELADELTRRGCAAESLHGDLSQQRREYVMGRFRKGIVSLLVATDVAARGLDIDDISHVFNADMPDNAEDYVHRIGRTGRAGRTGVAISFVHPRDRRTIGQIEAFIHQRIAEIRVPTPETIRELREARLQSSLVEQVQTGAAVETRGFIDRMVAMGLDPVEIATAAIQMLRASEQALPVGDLNEAAPARRKERPVRSEIERVETQRGRRPESAYKKAQQAPVQWTGKPGRANGKVFDAEAGMIRLRMNLGKTVGLHPSDVVGAIAGEVGIPGKAIGVIDIHQNHTFVDVSEKFARKVLNQSSGHYSLRGKPVTLTLAD